MNVTTAHSISAGDALGITLWRDGAREFVAAGLPGFTSATLAVGRAAAEGDATLELRPLVESPLLHAGPIEVRGVLGAQLFELAVPGEVFTAFEERIIDRYTAFRSALGWSYAGLYDVRSEGIGLPAARAVVYIVDVASGEAAQRLAEASGPAPADIRTFGEECSTYKVDAGTWLWLEPGRPA